VVNSLRFDCFEVDLEGGQIRKRGAALHLPDQQFKVLAALLDHPGDVVTRQALQRQLWPNEVFVDFDNVLNTVVARLRDALGDSAVRPRFIETLPKHGYRFIAAVSVPEATTRSAPVRRTRLLVLPFMNSSGDPAQDYFSDAMTDEIITELAALAPDVVGVIARTTAMFYKGSSKNIAAIARELNLDYVVEGTVRRASDRITWNVQLIRASDQVYTWAKKYDASLDDVFAIHRAIGQAIGEQLGVAPPGKGARRPMPTSDLVAYNCYIQGRYHFYRGESPEGVAKARQYLEAAIARDPRFAAAYATLAELWWYLGFFGAVPAKDALTVGIFHAVRAVEIDGALADTHAVLGQFRKDLDFNWAEVHREMSLALELDPRSPQVRMLRAITELIPFGRLDEAVADLECALDVDPLALFPAFWLVVMYWLKREYARGIERARALVEREPQHFTAHLVTGFVCSAAGLHAEAIAALRRAADLAGQMPMVLGWLGLALGESADVEGARTVYERLRAMSTKVYVPPTSFAFIHIGLGEVDGFFEWMHRAIDARDHMITPIKTYPFLDGIRDDPRYMELLRKMNLEAPAIVT